jgi:hypothetical protein
VDVSGIELDIRLHRFESDLVAHIDNISFLKNRYGTFFDLYAWQILNMGTPDTILLKSRLSSFIHDPDITTIYNETKKLYSTVSDLEKDLAQGLKRYHYHFPQRIVPQPVTFISGFNYAIVSADSTVGIGLDMYLGSESVFYPSLQIPGYKIRKMRREYIAVDAFRGWAQSEWEQDPSQTDLLSQMIYHGRIQYFIDQMLPETADTLKFGYTRNQLLWCEASEQSIWSFMLDHKLLFSSEPGKIGKYVNDGPTTNGFPKESPGNIGVWLGYRIVKAFMDKHSDATLEALMNHNDPHKLFKESGYKPGK